MCTTGCCSHGFTGLELERWIVDILISIGCDIDIALGIHTLLKVALGSDLSLPESKICENS